MSMTIESSLPDKVILPEVNSKKLPVMELFGPTIQGEGAVIGLQTHFIRFGLCDYKCKMCDSMHAVDGELVNKNATWLTQKELTERFLEHKVEAGYSTSWVTLSGGNPCIHDLGELITNFNELGIDVAVETQGTFCPAWLLGCSHITVSPKGPGMGEQCDLDQLDSFIDKLRTNGQDAMSMKIVIFDQRDLEFAAMLYERYVMEQKSLRVGQFFLSLGNPYPPGRPQGELPLRTLLLERFEDLLGEVMKHPILYNVKFLPQLHVLIWGNKQLV